MSCCSPHDLREYLFEELTPAQHGEVRAHLLTCAPCTTELDALRSTHTALLSVRDEEIPQRIGFVSDKVFEPSPLRRWFDGFWNSAARLGFVSAALLSAAILVYALRPAANIQNVHNSAQSAATQADLDRRPDPRIIQAVATQVKAQVDAQLQAKIDAAVTQAVAETEERAQKRTTALLARAQETLDRERWAQVVQAEQSRHDVLRKNAEIFRSNYGSITQ